MAFELRKPKELSLFRPTEEGILIQDIDINLPIHFPSHPFKLYFGARFEDMVNSIKEKGIMQPLILWKKDDNLIVLVGHNRLEAAKKAGLLHVPCIIKEDLTEDEAVRWVTSSNFIQRSFSELTYKEKIASIYMNHMATKKQGRRTDLIKENEEIKSLVSTSKNYELAESTKDRFIRLYRLIEPFKQMLDDKRLALTAADAVSYLKEEEQEELLRYIEDENIKISMTDGERLKKASLNNEWGKNTLKAIFENKIYKPKQVKIDYNKIEKFFKKGTSMEEVEKTINKALQFYYLKRGEN